MDQMQADPVLTFTDAGIYCPAGGFHIDPTRPVPRALITHGHSDHARRGHGSYLCAHAALPVIRHRLGRITAEGIAFGESRQIGGACVSFHPAGHVPGSAQIRIERAGEVWVVSGDYKTEADGLAEAFAPVPCHTFITECTFGLPIYQWQAQPQIMAQIAGWWADNAAAGVTSILSAYSFGKAQRLIAGLPGPILTHPVVEDVTEILRAQGYALPPTIRVTPQVTPQTHPGALIIAPPNALSSGWADRFAPHATAFASGWMTLAARRKAVGRGFVLSDHADWPGLNAAVRATGAARVFATHGSTAAFSAWLQTQGLQAGTVA